MTVRQSSLVGVIALAATIYVGSQISTTVRDHYSKGLFDGMTRESSYFPEGAVEFLRLNPIPGRMFTLYTWSGYTLFQLPDRPAFIDPRAHAVYPGKIWEESFTVEMGRPGWQEVLARQQVAIILWPAGVFADGGFRVLLDHLTAADEWIRVYDDGRAAVFAHTERGSEWIAAYQALTLRYPDVPDAQLFVGEALLRAGEFMRAREHFLQALVRHPSLREFFRETLIVKLDEQSRATQSPSLWFQLAFAHDILGDSVEAATNYRAAVGAGIQEPMFSFATTALERLRATPPS